MAALLSRIQELETSRWDLLRAHIGELNVELSRVFRTLTVHGDCVIDLPPSKRMLDTDGVTLMTRPRQHEWMPFSQLSGGQQCVTCISLSLALQQHFRCPFFLFDEVDASLDAVNTAMVAELLEALGGAGFGQFVLATLRAETYLHSNHLVGVYRRAATSCCVCWTPDH